MLDTIAHVLISPINLSLFGIGLGIALLTFTNLKRWVGKVLVWFSVIWVALCSQYFFSYWLIYPLEKAFPPVQTQSSKWQSADALWVLACYHYDAESLPLVSQFNHCSLERLVHAASMYRVNPMPIYLTGGKFNRSTELGYATQAAKLLVELGVKTSDVILVNKGEDTLSEAKELKKLIEHQTIAVISSATHFVRLSIILKNNYIDHIFVPVHYATNGKNVFRLNLPSSSALVRSERALYEYAALFKYWITE